MNDFIYAFNKATLGSTKIDPKIAMVLYIFNVIFLKNAHHVYISYRIIQNRYKEQRVVIM